MVVDSGHGLTSGSVEGGEIARQGALVGGMLTGELCVDDDWCMTGERPKALILLLLVLLGSSSGEGVDEGVREVVGLGEDDVVLGEKVRPGRHVLGIHAAF